MNNNNFYLRISIFLSLFLLLISSVLALVSISPSSLNISTCNISNFSVNVTISGVSDVYGFQFDLIYNSSFLDVLNVTEGSFLNNYSQESTYWSEPNISIPGLIDNTVCTRLGNTSVNSTSGVLAHILFDILIFNQSPATSNFSLAEVKISDINSQPLDNSSQGGNITIHLCSCEDGQTKNCTNGNGCNGNQTCTGGIWGSCISIQYFCDSDCDGDSECVDTNCSVCPCIEDWTCTGWSACSGGTQTRICTDNNACGTEDNKPPESQSCEEGGSGGGGGGGGGLIPPLCNENWACGSWSACGADGFKRRTCTDNNACDTGRNKPDELETCVYQGSCDDGIMNGDEEDVDCGGRCAPCPKIIKLDLPELMISVEPISAEILDSYTFEVIVENIGEKEVKDFEIIVNKWSEDSESVKSLSPGVSKKQSFLLSLPPDPLEKALEIQIIHNGSLILTTQSVDVDLSVPEFNLKLNKDPKTGKIYQALIVDNRDKPARKIYVAVTVNKGRKTYFIDIDRSYDVGENQIFHNVDYLYPKELSPGKYEVKSVFYEGGSKIGEAVSYLVLEGNGKLFNIEYVFYFILVVLVFVSMYVFFWSYKKG